MRWERGKRGEGLWEEGSLRRDDFDGTLVFQGVSGSAATWPKLIKKSPQQLRPRRLKEGAERPRLLDLSLPQHYRRAAERRCFQRAGSRPGGRQLRWTTLW